RDASLEVVANTLTSEAQVALTFLSNIRVAAIAATPQFIDTNGIPRRAVALVDVDSSQMPMIGMRARVPVPTDATAESVTGFIIDASGNWATPINPVAVNG